MMTKTSKNKEHYEGCTCFECDPSKYEPPKKEEGNKSPETTQTLNAKMESYKEMKIIKAHNFPEVYKWLGLNLNTLGCVMLDLEPLSIAHWLGQDGVTSYIYSLPLHISKNKERFWIDGWVADKVPHITLLYGLLEQGKNYQPHIQEVLRGWQLKEVEIEDIGFFESPYPDEKYWCIIAHIKKTDELLEGHARLSFLPHINTFPNYSPHMTLCYLKPVEELHRDYFIEDFRKEFKGKKLKVSDTLNLGGNN